MDFLEDFLLSEGFVYQHMMMHDSVMIGNTQKYHIVYYHNPINNIHAFIKTQPFRGALEAAKISYETIYESKKVCTTINGEKHYIPVAPEYVYLFDHYLFSFSEIYTAHLNDRNIENQIVSKETFSSSGIMDYKIYEEHSYIDAWKQIGIVKTTNYGYRFAVSWALWKFSAKSISGQKKFSKVLKAEKVEQTSHDSQSQTNGILSQLKDMEKPRGESNKMLWFSISLIAFVFLFGLLGLSVVDVLILVLVLLIHELGHYAAMRYFGYTDTNIFFLPFGAATVGKKEKRTAFEEYIVSLAGPLPGILIGSGILLLNLLYPNTFLGNEYLQMYAIMSLIINYINLLPIYPLDGGRILQTLLLLRYPKGQFYFYVISLGILITAMVWMQDPILLIFVVLLGFGLKQSYRISQLLQKLLKSKEQKKITQREVANVLVEDDKYSKETLASKANIAKQVLMLIHTGKPSKLLMVFGLSFYLFFLTPPFMMAFAGFYGAMTSEYSKLPPEAKDEVSQFHKELQSYRGLTQNSDENYTMQESMKILDKYLLTRESNATIGKPLQISKYDQTTLPCKLPEQLVEMYTWHDGIERLLIYDDLYSYKALEKNYAYELKEYGDNNNSIPITTYKNGSSLAYICSKKGLYIYPSYGSSMDKRYYSFNHFLKVTAEAYKAKAYYDKKDKKYINYERLEKIKKAYLSKEDQKRYEAMIVYLENRAKEYVDIAYIYHKTMIIRAMSNTFDIRLLHSMELYLHDEDEVVEEAAKSAIERLTKSNSSY